VILPLHFDVSWVGPGYVFAISAFREFPKRGSSSPNLSLNF
jgi:hypothetical protein